jgi:ribosomal protein S18 acetylase RimI-like enzyme
MEAPFASKGLPTYSVLDRGCAPCGHLSATVLEHDFSGVYRRTTATLECLRACPAGEPVVRPMTAPEFDEFRSRRVREYAAEQVRAGNWTADDAGAQAVEQTRRLLPQGAATPGVLLLTAETADGAPVGHVWVVLDRPPAGGAWIYDIEVLDGFRGLGYGRALLDAAERHAAALGARSIGLNVFGWNTVARSLYESAGYGVVSQQLSKELPPCA